MFLRSVLIILLKKYEIFLKSKILKTLQSPAFLFSWALLLKLMITGLSFADCLGALVILTALELGWIIKHKFPEQPDLFHEMSILQLQLTSLDQKTESIQSDVTSLKFGLNHKR